MAKFDEISFTSSSRCRRRISTKILPIVKAAIPAYEGMIGGRVRLFRNVDDPSQFVQVIEYDIPADFELNRQKLAGDPRIQTYLQGWRALFPGTFEIDVLEDVADWNRACWRVGEPLRNPSSRIVNLFMGFARAQPILRLRADCC